MFGYVTLQLHLALQQLEYFVQVEFSLIFNENINYFPINIFQPLTTIRPLFAIFFFYFKKSGKLLLLFVVRK